MADAASRVFAGFLSRLIELMGNPLDSLVRALLLADHSEETTHPASAVLLEAVGEGRIIEAAQAAHCAACHGNLYCAKRKCVAHIDRIICKSR